MKKILVAVLLVLLMAGTSFAAWTIALETTGYPKTYDMSDGTTAAIFKINLLSDADASGAFTLSTLINTAFASDKPAAALWNRVLSASVLYCMKTTLVGSVTDSTIVVSDEVDAQIMSQTTGTSGSKLHYGGVDSGFQVPVTDLSFTMTTLGNTEVGAIYLWLIKKMPK
jgi:hypothetical protein